MLRAAGVPERNLYGTPADKAEPLDMLCGRSARHAMQTLGTEWRDTIGRDLWSRMWLAGMDERGAVCDDVRFAHEVKTIRSQCGVIVRVVRSLADLDRRPQHASEDFASLPFDVQVVNDGCTNQLRRSLETALRAKLPASCFIPAARVLVAAPHCS